MEIKTTESMQFLAENGDILSMQFGYPLDNKGRTVLPMYTRFYGKKIPIPVKSGIWIQGLSKADMLTWMRKNGYVMQAKYNLCTGLCRGYNVPDSLLAEAEEEKRKKNNQEMALNSAIRIAWSLGDTKTAQVLLSLTEGKLLRNIVVDSSMFNTMEMVERKEPIILEKDDIRKEMTIEDLNNVRGLEVTVREMIRNNCSRISTIKMVRWWCNCWLENAKAYVDYVSSKMEH